MTDEPLSVAQAHAAAEQLGKPIGQDGQGPCPICDEPLGVSQNGVGAHITPSCACPPQAIVAVYLATGATDAASAGHRALRLQAMSKLVELPVAGAVKHGRNGDAYDLLFTDGRGVRLGNAADMLNKRKFEAAFLGQLDHLVILDTKQHRELCGAIAKIAEHRDTVATDDEETLAWLSTYTRRTARHLISLDNKDELWDILGATIPFATRDKRIGLRLDDFYRYATRELGQRVTSRELSIRLSGLGFTKPEDPNPELGRRGQLAVRRGTEIRSGRFWISPPDFEALG